jgi:hypothetical protein
MSIEVLADKWAVEQDLLLGCALLERENLKPEEILFLKGINMYEKSDFCYNRITNLWLNLRVYSEASHGESQLRKEIGG